MTIILALTRLRQVDYKVKDSLGYPGIPVSQNKPKTKPALRLDC